MANYTASRLGGLLLFVLLAGGVRAQSSLPVQVDLDHASFAYDGENSMVEVYLAFEARSLHYNHDSLGYQAKLPLDLSLRRSTLAGLPGTPTEPVWADSVMLSFMLADTSGLLEGQHFVHQLRLTTQPGEYELQVVVPADEQAGRQELMLRRDLVVPDYADASLVRLSDLTLASSIERSQNRDDPFYKNGLQIRPNANQLFGSGLNHLFYYAEAYQLEGIADDQDEYTLFTYISEANRPQPVGSLEKRDKRKARNPDVLVGSFDLSELPSGSYFLRMAVLDAENEAIAEQARKFFVYNPSVAREQPLALENSFETSEYASMTEEEVERSIEHISIIASETEKRRIRRIEDLDERRRFLMEFWTKRDPNPGQQVNGFKEEFYRRLQYANDRYSNNRSEGWKTDRGRTILKYGLPSAIEPHLYERDMEPYELWQYNNIPGEGQALFVFADMNGFGEFQLLHSTVSGEPKLADWQRDLRRL